MATKTHATYRKATKLQLITIRAEAVAHARQHGRKEITVICANCHRGQATISVDEAEKRIYRGWLCPSCARGRLTA